MRSVVEQGYRNVEYSVLDGGSTDRTIEILRKYDAQLSFWRSEKDRGCRPELLPENPFADGCVPFYGQRHLTKPA